MCTEYFYIFTKRILKKHILGSFLTKKNGVRGAKCKVQISTLHQQSQDFCEG